MPDVPSPRSRGKVPEGRLDAQRKYAKDSEGEELRKVENEARKLHLHNLRGRRLNGFKFVRQLPIGLTPPISYAERPIWWWRWAAASMQNAP